MSRITGAFGANSWRSGDSRAVCDECGGVFYRSEMRERWDRAIVCKNDWEPRQPQDFVRAKKDKIMVKGSRPEPADRFLTTNEIQPEDL